MKDSVARNPLDQIHSLGWKSIKYDDRMKKVSLAIFWVHFSEMTHKTLSNTMINWRKLHQQAFESSFLWRQIQIHQIQWWITKLDLDYRERYHLHISRAQINPSHRDISFDLLITPLSTQTNHPLKICGILPKSVVFDDVLTVRNGWICMDPRWI